MVEAAFRVAGMREILMNHDREDHFAILTDVPMWLVVFITIAHEERAILVVEPIDTNPRGEGEGLKFSWDIDANSSTGAAEF